MGIHPPRMSLENTALSPKRPPGTTHRYKMSVRGQFTEIETVLVVTAGSGGGGCSLGRGFPWGAGRRWGLPGPVNVLNVTELITLKWLILCHMKFTSKTGKE